MIKILLVLLLAVLATATMETSAGLPQRRLLSKETKDADPAFGGSLRSRRFLSRTRENCDDTSNGYCDSWNDCCDEYHDHKYWCGGYDTPNFQSKRMCCACGGGKLKQEDKHNLQGYGSNYKYLGEGECRQEDGDYPLKFQSYNHYFMSREKCEKLCNRYRWCFAYQFQFNEAPRYSCDLVTDYNTFVLAFGAHINTYWGAMIVIDRNQYSTLCKGNGKYCERTVYGKGSFNPRQGRACYQKIGN